MEATHCLVYSCNGNVDIQMSFPFNVETLPVPKKLKVGEMEEIRCPLKQDGWYLLTSYAIMYFQLYGVECFKISEKTVLLPNDLYQLLGQTLWLYYTSASTDQQTIDVNFRDSFEMLNQLTFCLIIVTRKRINPY